KKSGYRLDYASSARAKCKGPKPCAGTTIPKGGLRLGSVVDFRGSTTYVWRHWGCTTPKILSNMKGQFPSADELDGFEDLKDEDKDRVQRAFDEGKVADDDIPESARKADGDDDAEE
ncbi:zf-PARP-domain-containing protein, partial [Gyrodon lividus]